MSVTHALDTKRPGTYSLCGKAMPSGTYWAISPGALTCARCKKVHADKRQQRAVQQKKEPDHG